MEIFKFQKFTELIKYQYKRLKELEPNYSIKDLLHNSGLSGAVHLKLILEGRVELDRKTARSLAKNLKLDPTETDYFRNLVAYNQSRSKKGKSHYLEILSKFWQKTDLSESEGHEVYLYMNGV